MVIIQELYTDPCQFLLEALTTATVEVIVLEEEDGIESLPSRCTANNFLIYL